MLKQEVYVFIFGGKKLLKCYNIYSIYISQEIKILFFSDDILWWILALSFYEILVLNQESQNVTYSLLNLFCEFCQPAILFIRTDISQ